MNTPQKFPYKGYAIFPQIVPQDNGLFAACFTIQSGYDGSGGVRYARELPSTEFASEEEAVSYILDFSAEWIDQNPL